MRPVSVYLILLLHLTVVSFSSYVFLFRCKLHPLSLPLPSCLGCIPPLIGLPSLRFMRLPLVCFYCLYDFVCVFYFLFLFFVYRDHVLCWLLSCPFSSVCFPCLSPISALIWFGSVYLVTTAGFVADQLMRDNINNNNNNNNNNNTMFRTTHRRRTDVLWCVG